MNVAKELIAVNKTVIILLVYMNVAATLAMTLMKIE